VVYDKIVAIPKGDNVLYLTFSAQGDTHNGSALLMQGLVNGTACQPLLGQTGGGGGGKHIFPHWYTLNVLPRSTTGLNCNDGGGGTADCHDNTIAFSCCSTVSTTAPTARVQIKLADLPGGGSNVAFYERSTIYIDGQAGRQCRGVSTRLHE
jgi:hypothetical protein